LKLHFSESINKTKANPHFLWLSASSDAPTHKAARDDGLSVEPTTSNVIKQVLGAQQKN
jgi:hypothetical protein